MIGMCALCMRWGLVKVMNEQLWLNGYTRQHEQLFWKTTIKDKHILGVLVKKESNSYLDH